LRRDSIVQQQHIWSQLKGGCRQESSWTCEVFGVGISTNLVSRWIVLVSDGLRRCQVHPSWRIHCGSLDTERLSNQTALLPSCDASATEQQRSLADDNDYVVLSSQTTTTIITTTLMNNDTCWMFDSEQQRQHCFSVIGFSNNNNNNNNTWQCLWVVWSASLVHNVVILVLVPQCLSVTPHNAVSWCLECWHCMLSSVEPCRSVGDELLSNSFGTLNTQLLTYLNAMLSRC